MSYSGIGLTPLLLYYLTEDTKFWLGALTLDVLSAAKIGLQYDAEIVIMGKATSTPSGNVMGTRIKSVHASILAKAIRTDNAEIIASQAVCLPSNHILMKPQG